MIITKKALNYVFEITKYLYFNLELGQEIELSKLTKEQNRDRFVSALDFIITRNLTLLGGFQIRYIDETRQAIKKVPHIKIKHPKGHQEQKNVLPFEFETTKDGNPLVLIEPYEKLFEYGNT